VIKTTTRQTVFLPVTGLLDSSNLKPGELIGVNKDGYMLYEKLPPEYDARVKTMEVDERPNEDYTDIGGLEKQIEELREAIVLPITHKEKFENIGIRYLDNNDSQTSKRCLNAWTSRNRQNNDGQGMCCLD
jgi:26S proteasome regulatory subunit T5